MNHMLKVRLMYVLLAKLGINYISISNSSKNPVKRQNKTHKGKITMKALVQKQCLLRRNAVNVGFVLFYSITLLFIAQYQKESN